VIGVTCRHRVQFRPLQTLDAQQNMNVDACRFGQLSICGPASTSGRVQTNGWATAPQLSKRRRKANSWSGSSRTQVVLSVMAPEAPARTNEVYGNGKVVKVLRRLPCPAPIPLPHLNKATPCALSRTGHG